MLRDRVESGQQFVLRDIATYATEALARYGVHGRVTVQDESFAVLDAYGASVATDLGSLPQLWLELSHEERQRRSGELARELVRLRRLQSQPPPKPSLTSTWFFRVAAGVLVVSALLALRWVVPRFITARAEGPEAAIASGRADQSAEGDRQRFAQRACSASAIRAARGEPLGVADAEGWVVEIGLVRLAAEGDPAQDPRLRRFVGGPFGHQTLAWRGLPTLDNLAAVGGGVAVATAALPPLEPRWYTLTLALSGPLAAPYFREEARWEYRELAQALVKELGAELASVSTRCPEQASRQLGSWFHGPTPGQAAASLVFFLGVHAESPHLRADLRLAPGNIADDALALANIEQATRHLKLADIRLLIGKHGGAVTGADRVPTSLLFEFKDASRSVGASRELSRSLGLDDGR